MPGEISQSYDGPGDPCPGCRLRSDGTVNPHADSMCGVCHGSGWMPDDYVCSSGQHRWESGWVGGDAEHGLFCVICGAEMASEH